MPTPERANQNNVRDLVQPIRTKDGKPNPAALLYHLQRGLISELNISDETRRYWEDVIGSGNETEMERLTQALEDAFVQKGLLDEYISGVVGIAEKGIHQLVMRRRIALKEGAEATDAEAVLKQLI